MPIVGYMATVFYPPYLCSVPSSPVRHTSHYRRHPAGEVLWLTKSGEEERERESNSMTQYTDKQMYIYVLHIQTIAEQRLDYYSSSKLAIILWISSLSPAE